MASHKHRRANARFLADLIARHRDGLGAYYEVTQRVAQHFGLGALDILKVRAALRKRSKHSGRSG